MASLLDSRTQGLIGWLPSRRGKFTPSNFFDEDETGQKIGGVLGTLGQAAFGGNKPQTPSMGMDSLAQAPRPGFNPPGGLIGSGGRSLRATPQQEAESRRVEAQLGLPPNATAQNVQPLTGFLGSVPERPQGFWQGGEKFRGKDALAGVLAVLGDVAAQQSGSTANSVATLGDMRTKGIDTFKDEVKAHERNRQIASLPGMSAREFMAYSADPKGWGGHMSDAYSSHHAAANVSPGEQRVFGNPTLGGSIYQAPTAAEQYAGSLGFTPGSQGYNAAMQDYTLRANGPTAFGFDKALDDHRTDNDMGMESLRQRNRMAMQGAQQSDRMDLRSSPTYRDLNPPPPRTSTARPSRRRSNPTATGPNGEKLEYNGSAWVPVR